MKEGVNQFARLGISDEKVRDRVAECFRTIFEDPEERFFHEVDADSACGTKGRSFRPIFCLYE